nr:unnamed protein product [Digitaria exilis]
MSSASLEITDGAAGADASLTVFQFDGFIDLDAYDTIAMKIKGDGRCYISTVCISSQESV